MIGDSTAKSETAIEAATIPVSVVLNIIKALVSSPG